LIKYLIPNLTNFGLVLFLAIVVSTHSWFVDDYKIFYNIQRTLICVVLSFLFIVFGVYTKDIYFATIATIPMSSIIVILFANKLLGTKIDSLVAVRKWDRLFGLILFALTVLLSAVVFFPILKQIMEIDK